jgi:signal peptidase II
MKKYVWFFVCTFVVLVVDLVTKNWVDANMSLWQVDRITSYFNLVYVRNSGAAFGILSNADASIRIPFFVSISLIAFGVIGYLVYKAADNVRYTAGLGLILGGAMGNFVDRIRSGSVIDFLDFHIWGRHWPSFNVADIGISVGVGLLLLDALLETRRERAEAARAKLTT